MVIRRKLIILATTAALPIAGMAGSFSPALAAPAVAAKATGSVPHPGQSSFLQGVAAVAPHDAWAVGTFCSSHCTSVTATDHYMIIHWNGSSWSLTVRGPSGGLGGISAVSARDLWAVGSTPTGPLFLHWNGKIWSHGKSAAFPPAAGVGAVDALSASDAWAVGSAYSAKIGAYVTLAARWNGSKWSPVATPPVARKGGQAGLNTVSGTDGKNVWAAGNSCSAGCKSFRGLIMHWNGSKWQQTSLPAGVSDIFTVKALSQKDAWALGQSVSAQNAAATVMLRWNGSRWLKVNIPQDFPETMTFVSPSDGWAIGLAVPILHWNGAKWQAGQESTPNWGGGINAASADAANDVWVVGERCTKNCPAGIGPTQGIILHWNGSKWTVS